MNNRNLSFFVDLDCKNADQLRKCIKLYPQFDWYLGFQYTGNDTSNVPEKIGIRKEQRLQLFNFSCPLLPKIGRHVGLYCSNINRNPLQYCISYLAKHSNDIPVFIIHKTPRYDNPIIPRITYVTQRE